MTPRYSWQIDPSKLNITGQEVMQKLADTRPIVSAAWAPVRAACADAIRTLRPADNHGEHHQRAHATSDPNSFGFAVWQLKDGEDKMIADRLVEIFSAASKA